MYALFVPSAVNIFGKIKDQELNSGQFFVPMEDKEDKGGYDGLL